MNNAALNTVETNLGSGNDVESLEEQIFRNYRVFIDQSALESGKGAFFLKETLFPLLKAIKQPGSDVKPLALLKMTWQQLQDWSQQRMPAIQTAQREACEALALLGAHQMVDLAEWPEIEASRMPDLGPALISLAIQAYCQLNVAFITGDREIARRLLYVARSPIMPQHHRLRVLRIDENTGKLCNWRNSFIDIDDLHFNGNRPQLHQHMFMRRLSNARLLVDTSALMLTPAERRFYNKWVLPVLFRDNKPMCVPRRVLEELKHNGRSEDPQKAELADKGFDLILALRRRDLLVDGEPQMLDDGRYADPVLVRMIVEGQYDQDFIFLTRDEALATMVLNLIDRTNSRQHLILRLDDQQPGVMHWEEYLAARRRALPADTVIMTPHWPSAKDAATQEAPAHPGSPQSVRAAPAAPPSRKDDEAAVQKHPTRRHYTQADGAANRPQHRGSSGAGFLRLQDAGHRTASQGHPPAPRGRQNRRPAEAPAMPASKSWAPGDTLGTVSGGRILLGAVCPGLSKGRYLTFNTDRPDVLCRVLRHGILEDERICSLQQQVRQTQLPASICRALDIVVNADGRPVGQLMPSVSGEPLADLDSLDAVRKRFPAWKRLDLALAARTLVDALLGAVSHGVDVSQLTPAQVRISAPDTVHLLGLEDQIGASADNHAPPAPDFELSLSANGALLVWWLLMPGYSPYTSAADVSWEQMKQGGTFIYGHNSGAAEHPVSFGSRIWGHMTLTLKNAFLRAFRDRQALPLPQLRRALDAYLRELEGQISCNEIAPRYARVLNAPAREVVCAACGLRFPYREDKVQKLAGKAIKCDACREEGATPKAASGLSVIPDSGTAGSAQSPAGEPAGSAQAQPRDGQAPGGSSPGLVVPPPANDPIKAMVPTAIKPQFRPANVTRAPRVEPATVSASSLAETSPADTAADAKMPREEPRLLKGRVAAQADAAAHGTDTVEEAGDPASERIGESEPDALYLRWGNGNNIFGLHLTSEQINKALMYFFFAVVLMIVAHMLP